MTARIFRPAPNAMQSGRGRSKAWILEHDRAAPLEIEPLMGYTSTTDTRTQVRISFDTLEEAEAFAQKNGIAYRVQKPQVAKVQRNAYPDNFRADRKTPWTH
jgi:hypothetical protein